ncbi:unnamed protein product [Meganyctiphanes norvegica]|uniref:Fibrinogen C-terminal domain-containing protein n=1 Tax=Meganyctiphanes norvegica TaxID=48144 RepID=A0AAV2QIE0_MEGNR
MYWLSILLLMPRPHGNMAELGQGIRNQDLSDHETNILQDTTQQVLNQMQELKGVVLHTNKDDYILLVIKALQKDLTQASEGIQVLQGSVTSQGEKMLNLIEDNQNYIQSLSEKLIATSDILTNYSKELKDNSLYANVKIELMQQVCVSNFKRLDNKINELNKNMILMQNNQEGLFKANTKLVMKAINDTQKHSHSHLSFPSDCQDLLVNGHNIDGVHEIYPFSETMSSVPVWCDMAQTHGWTVLLARKSQIVQVNFQHKWGRYKSGFGRPDSEYWLGLEPLRRITKQHHQVLRVEVEDWDGQEGWAEYTDFWIEGEDQKYRLHVGNYTGNIGDALKHHNGKKFSTFDQDNDDFSSGNCATQWHGKGGFWFGVCALTNPTGIFLEKQKSEMGITWQPWTNSWETLKKLVIKIRPQ